MRRAAAELREEGAMAERKAVLDHLAAKIAETTAIKDKGRITALEHRMLCRRLAAAAEDISQGLHV